ncbi:MAG: MFS transporter [Chloroflexi bacterium]|nr:MFS transporter [Chloroflexota bacterium]
MATEKAEARPRLRERGSFILGSMAVGHGMTHWFAQSFWVLLPKIATEMALGPVAVGFLPTVRFAVSGVVNLPGGVIVDLLRRRWRHILAGCMLWLALAYGVLGIAPNFGVLLIAMVLVALPGTVWHLPAIAALSRRFPERRGFALATHGVGGNVGDTLGPLLVGFLLGVITWRGVLNLYTIPAVVMAFVVWWALHAVSGGAQARHSMREGFQRGFRLLRNRTLLGLVVAAGFRSMGFNALLTWLPFYMKDELGRGDWVVGIHISLLTALGLSTSQVLGATSDRFGRKLVLVPGLVIIGMLALLLTRAGAGVGLTLVVAGIGLFFYAIQHVIIATAMDVAGKDTEATGVGIIFGLSQIFSSTSPLVAGALVGWYGIGVAFYFVGVVTLVSAAIIAILPLRRPARRGGEPKAAV